LKGTAVVAVVLLPHAEKIDTAAMATATRGRNLNAFTALSSPLPE
jgi:hypothetical protein